MAGRKNIFSLLKKYGLFLCVPIFFAAAYFYSESIYPQYKVSAKITVQDVPVASVINDIKSRALVQKTISQLPLTAKFYSINSPKKELYADSVPARFVFSGANKVNIPTRLEFAATSGGQYTLSNNDTITYHQFNELINEYYGKFIVEKNPLFKSSEQTFIVKLDEPGQVLDQFYNNLHVDAGIGNNTVTVSILAGNARQGIDFLNMLFRLYDAANPHTAAVAAVPVTANADAINDNINTLKQKAWALESKIKKLKEQNKNIVRTPKAKSKLDEKQARIYAAIKPYVKKSVDQFVQIPFVDEIEDPELNDEVNDYNETELAKQHMLASSSGNNGEIDTTNKKLMMLRSDIFEKITKPVKDDNAGVVLSSANPATTAIIKSKEDSLNEFYKNIRAERSQAAIVKAAPVKPYVAVSGSRLVMLAKPGDSIEYIPVNELMIYGIALLAAVLVLFVRWLIRKSNQKTTRYASFDSEKISEKLNNLFAEKQID